MSFEEKAVINVFQKLDDESALCVLGLCLAANDLGANLETIGQKQRDEERVFAFACSLSIIREIAKMMETIDRSPARQRFSQETERVFQRLQKDLVPFHSGTLTKDTLKAVRDVTFHYDWTEVKRELKIQSLLKDLKSEVDLRVRLSCGDDSCLGTRYLFADMFRNEYVSTHLTRSIVSQLSEVAMDIIRFTDSLLFDLSK